MLNYLFSVELFGCIQYCFKSSKASGSWCTTAPSVWRKVGQPLSVQTLLLAIYITAAIDLYFMLTWLLYCFKRRHSRWQFWPNLKSAEHFDALWKAFFIIIIKKLWVRTAHVFTGRFHADILTCHSRKSAFGCIPQVIYCAWRFTVVA